jgi:cell division transport system permease protein
MLDRFEFLLGEAFVSLRRNTWMTFAAVTTAAMALFLFGLLAALYAGLTSAARALGERSEVKAFLSESVRGNVLHKIERDLKAVPGVASVRFEGKKEALKKFQAQNPNLDIAGLDIDNPLPNAYVVRLDRPEQVEAVVSGIEEVQGVEHVGYAKEEQGFLADLLRAVPWLGLTLGLLMLLTSGVLIYNAIRLTVLARRREIRIMQLVGASRAMVRAPLLIEGVVQGAAGGVLATLVLWMTYSILENVVVRNLTVTGPGLAFHVLPNLLVLTFAGAVYGLVCSLLAVGDPVRLGRRA